MGIVNPFANDGDWTESGGNVYRESGKVGIGTDDPQRPLHVSGVGQFGDSTTNGDIKIYGSTGSTPSLTVGLTDAGAGQDWQIQNTASNFTLAMGSGLSPVTVLPILLWQWEAALVLLLFSIVAAMLVSIEAIRIILFMWRRMMGLFFLMEVAEEAV